MGAVWGGAADEGASYDEVRKLYGMPASTLRRYKAALREPARRSGETT
jgi:hypothetical protein